MNNYYVFSDETGHWNDTKYIRSWLIILEEEYFKLIGKMKLFKEIHNIKGELKYSPGYDYSIFEDLEFNSYFTITFCEDFNGRNFKLIEHLNSQNIDLFTINHKDIKDKIFNTIKNSIFLNIYEYYHLKNTIDFLGENYSDNKITFFIDSPQYQNRDWKKVFSEAGGETYFLKIINKSEDVEGIQFADILAGICKSIFEKMDRNSELNSFEKKIIKKFSQQNGSDKKYLNNPQIIMWDIKYEELVSKINNLIENS
jgi:hypothetical protein